MTLQQHLVDNPGIKVVYFNAEGEHIFHKTDKFNIEKSREEVLDEKTETKVKKRKDEKNI